MKGVSRTAARRCKAGKRAAPARRAPARHASEGWGGGVRMARAGEHTCIVVKPLRSAEVAGTEWVAPFVADFRVRLMALLPSPFRCPPPPPPPHTSATSACAVGGLVHCRSLSRNDAQTSGRMVRDLRVFMGLWNATASVMPHFFETVTLACGNSASIVPWIASDQVRNQPWMI